MPNLTPKLPSFLKCFSATNHNDFDNNTEQPTPTKNQLIKSIKKLFKCFQTSTVKNQHDSSFINLSLSQLISTTNPIFNDETNIGNKHESTPSSSFEFPAQLTRHLPRITNQEMTNTPDRESLKKTMLCQPSHEISFTSSRQASALHLYEEEKNPEEVTIEAYKITLKEINSGILPEHLYAMTIAADKMKCILSIRPVSLHAKYWTLNGHPTKSMLIHDKSEKKGIGAGLVRTKTRNARETIIDPDTGQKFIAIGQPYLFNTERISEVINNPNLYQINPESIKYFNQHNEETNSIDQAKTILYCLENNQTQSSPENTYQILKKTKEGWALFEEKITGHLTPNHSLIIQKFKNFRLPVHFWCYKKEIDGVTKYSPPVTADYDILTTFFNTVEYSADDLKRPIDTGDIEAINKIKSNPLWSQLEIIRKGNANPATIELIRKINQSIKTIYPEISNENDPKKTYKSHTEVHHSGEATNPCSPPEVNETALFPAVFVFPKELNLPTPPQNTNANNASTEISAIEETENIKITHNM